MTRSSRRRSASREEIDLWRSAMRDVQRLSRRPARKTAPPAETVAATVPAPQSEPRASSTAPQQSTRTAERDLPKIGGHAAPGLDRATAEKLRRGRYTIERRIDLHGMTQEEAHRALDGFIGRAAEDGVRCVLVITGKGLRKLSDDEGGRTSSDYGVLRHAVPRWLNEPPTRARVIAFGPAQPRHGGGGALYVLLRRRR